MPTGEELLKLSEPVRQDVYLRLKEKHARCFGVNVQEFDSLIDTYPAFELRTKPHAKSPSRARPPVSHYTSLLIPVNINTPSSSTSPGSVRSNIESIATIDTTLALDGLGHSPKQSEA